MGKHSKNNNDRAFFSYHERKAASSGRMASGLLGGHNTADGNFKEWGWGTERRTLDSDAMKDIDACSLSLQPCVDPVVTPQGVLYDKGVLIEYILQRKKDLERETAAWEAQQAAAAGEAAGEAAAAQQARVDEFLAQQEGLSQSDLRARGALASRGAVSMGANGRVLVADKGVHAADMNFWVPSATPQAAVVLQKPDGVVRCPISGQPLRLKQLVSVKFTLADEGRSAGDLVGMQAKERYICPLTKKPLSNIYPATVLRPSGMVVSSACVKDIIKKDMLDPFTDPPTILKEKDLIPLRVEGTGFAAKTDEKHLKVTIAKPAGHF